MSCMHMICSSDMSLLRADKGMGVAATFVKNIQEAKDRSIENVDVSCTHMIGISRRMHREDVSSCMHAYMHAHMHVACVRVKAADPAEHIVPVLVALHKRVASATPRRGRAAACGVRMVCGGLGVGGVRYLGLAPPSLSAGRLAILNTPVDLLQPNSLFSKLKKKSSSPHSDEARNGV